MTIIVFTGPTLPPGEVEEHLQAQVMPPAAQGDIYRSLARNPRAIGLIDGYFQGHAAVWHKEILHALDRGVHVFGAASMGALRAAELHSFGMRGIGQIFQDYASGILQDDDAVAVEHAPGDLGFMPLSEPLVNIRATLTAAQDAGILDADATRSALHHAEAMHYPDRSWKSIVAHLAKSGDVAAFEAWLETGRIDQKRLDAVDMLAAMRSADLDQRPQIGFDFVHTMAWQRLIEDCSASGLEDPDVIEELRLDPALHERISKMAHERFLALEGSQLPDLAIVERDVRQARTAWRRQNALTTQSALEDWCKRQCISLSQCDALIADQVRIDRVAEYARPYHGVHMLAVLKITGRYAALRQRADAKSAVLQQHGLVNADPGDTGMTRRQLTHWYFADRCRITPPDDLRQWCSSMGYQQPADFLSALVREYLFLTLPAHGMTLSRGKESEGRPS